MQSHPSRIPARLEDVAYVNLSGRVKREDDALYAKHGGGYADIFVGYLANDNGTRTKVAIKVLRTTNEPEVVDIIRKYVIRETTVWQKLSHPNVLKFLGLAPDIGRFGCPALISPYCDRGTANDHLKLYPDIDTRLFLIKGVAQGLEYLHLNEVIHGDLKPSNILIDNDGRPLLCDFGRSKILATKGFTTKPAGACRYQAPELLHGEGPNNATDVYAFALTSYEIWTGLLPFHHIHQDTAIIISIVMQKARPEYPEPTPLGTDPLWRLFEDCWKETPGNRLDMEAVVYEVTKMALPKP